MSRKAILAVLFAGVLVMSASAQAFTVSYLDGSVELQSAKGWTTLSIGDKVPADATVRVSQSGALELVRSKTKISLLKDGVYAMAGLSAAAGAGAGGVGSTIAQKLQTLVTEKPRGSAAGGVRGAEQGTATVTWVDEGDETLTKVQALLDKKRYPEAETLLQSSIKDSTSDQDTAQFKYLLGVAYYGAGQTARAYKTLANAAPTPDAPWYARYVILRAQVLVDTRNFSDALALLGPFIATYPTGEATQVAYLLSGLSQKGLGNPSAAKAAFDAGFQMNQSNDTAKLIDEQRNAP